MRTIAKGREPQSLTAHRKTAHSDYGNYEHKAELRTALVAEQRGLCCYCMDRIRNNRVTKIEHWRPQGRFSDQQLVYRNLLAACSGGTGKAKSQQHCDTRKGDQDLSWNPADPNHHIETRIRYELDGSIWSDDEAFNAELDDVLNLNLPTLKNHRKGLLDGIAEWWRTERARLRRSNARSLQRHRTCWLPEHGELRPFCQVAVWALDQRLSRLQR